ncbi:cysteine desulfurase family protein [Geoalkalibacter halelectricus]|uniref:cysteine desulfurase n=1 Tax=Geoalkalibacter halelectricus TaxID=2847045 RepID=A0ABY5ZNX0_9BACT|nr:aminotransferase class V-fold PLP-dependent enzyme [Geoalkalibacter halelectricus]MDO3377299.1 aminotransferase class V-fold PLP-dependent enzyme [Geoalkalibacter halelectricus]UWZ78936.1 aminotransferase class V-fold PLP-dependent enzyme [Geoalkalibacter halelectricus]
MPIYLDCNATTPVEPGVATLVKRFLEKDFGNPASPIHDYGVFARAAVDHARKQIARVVDARPDEVIFTSGATESNNLAILGLVEEGMRSWRRHVITTAIEHKAVLEPCMELERLGFEVEVVPVRPDGRFDPERIAAALRPDTLLVSTMQVNNETGVLQPLTDLAGILADHDAWWHVDAAQGFGKEFASLRHDRIDMISISGHKIYGPKGVGALIARKRGQKLPPLRPLMYGGGQEQGLRAGTLPVLLIAGLGEAAKLALRHQVERREKCLAMRGEIIAALASLGAQQNGAEAYTLPHVINVSLPGIDADRAINALKQVVAVSSTSACTSHTKEPSHVLLAMGCSSERVETSLRFSWCHLTEDVDWDEVSGILANLRTSKGA